MLAVITMSLEEFFILLFALVQFVFCFCVLDGVAVTTCQDGGKPVVCELTIQVLLMVLYASNDNHSVAVGGTHTVEPL